MVRRVTGAGWRRRSLGHASVEATTYDLRAVRHVSNVYLVVGHRNRTLLEDLFRHIWSKDHYFLIHVDQKAPAETRAFARQVGDAFVNVRTVPPRLCSWAGWSVTSVILEAVEMALQAWESWDHFIPLTEHHLPLRTADDCARRLELGVSYCDAVRVVDMYPCGRDDALHRVEWVWSELPGVGHFAVGQRGLAREFLYRLHHGSACFVLARDASRRIHELMSNEALRSIFATSVASDEIAIQTILCGFEHPERLRIEPTIPTFVAVPHLSGSSDAIFSEMNFQDAIDAGYCFIRKRPLKLSPSSESKMNEIAAFGRTDLANRLAPFATVFMTDAPADAAPLVAEISTVLACMWPAARINHLDSQTLPNVPLMELVITSDLIPPDLSVYLISADLQNYKIVLMSWTPHDGTFEPRIIDAQICHLLRARVYDLFFHQEVMCPFDPRAGFGTISVTMGVAPLVRHIAMYLDHAVRIADRRKIRGLIS